MLFIKRSSRWWDWFPDAEIIDDAVRKRCGEKAGENPAIRASWARMWEKRHRRARRSGVKT
ncbi:hypothetical protein [Pseudoduganella plicata]|uniref:Uncharacterized protein n=1 Tax=Pseudoduganella plicata TaxID=321984 RepID=A0ABX5SA51_9BURK|nr:hypothetical protein [Pseudoduganella plicata]QBQ36462.1 hypothetical protein E1742_10020 [Pseudoduganella plicata]